MKKSEEMVFDIDPPNQSKFPVAVKAAQLIKELCDYKELVSIAKTSGRKGLQIHIPTDGAWTYDETREFMETVAKVLVQKYPDLFTIERMKKIEANAFILISYNMLKEKQSSLLTPLVDKEMQR